MSNRWLQLRFHVTAGTEHMAVIACGVLVMLTTTVDAG